MLWDTSISTTLPWRSSIGAITSRTWNCQPKLCASAHKVVVPHHEHSIIAIALIGQFPEETYKLREMMCTISFSHPSYSS